MVGRVRVNDRSETTAEQAHASADPGDAGAIADVNEAPARRWLWRLLGPTLGLATFALVPESEALGADGRAVAGLVVLMAVWWMSEAFPLPVTSLLPIVALPLFGVVDIEGATAPYASPTVFLFLGGFVIALAMQHQGLHTRVALRTLRLVGTDPRRMLLGVMLATGGLSMWVSNTAAALMMLPIGLSILGMTGAGPDADGASSSAGGRRFATCMVLAIAYAATIGGLGTLIGSPPTLLMAGFASRELGIDIGFADWMLLGVPIALVFLVLAWLFLSRVAFPPDVPELRDGGRVVREQAAALGRMSSGERTVATVFALTAALWVGHGPLSELAAVAAVAPWLTLVTDEGIAMAAAVALLALPVRGTGGRPCIPWTSAQRDLPWGVLLLFGGGLSLARGVGATGLDAYIGSLLAGVGTLPLVLTVAVVAAVVLGLTELTSNTATAATFVPVLAGVAVAAGLDPLTLLVPAALAATCAFMLPVGTPPERHRVRLGARHHRADGTHRPRAQPARGRARHRRRAALRARHHRLTTEGGAAQVSPSRARKA